MGKHGVERILIRNEFYQSSYRMLSLAFVLILACVLALIGLVFYQGTLAPKPKYFATTPSGLPIPVVRLDAPYYQDPAIVSAWAEQAVLTIYSLDYVTWRQSLQSVEGYFTTRGYEDFLKALKASTNLEAIKNKRQIVSATITGISKITRAGQINANEPYSWDIQMPVTITYQNSTGETIKQNGTVLMLVERTSLLRYKDGIAIEQLVLQAS